MPMKPAAPESTAPISEADRDQPAEEIADDEEDHDADDADGGVLALEIGLRALAHGRRDLLHFGAAGIGASAPTGRPDAVDDGEQAAEDDQPQSCHWTLTPVSDGAAGQTLPPAPGAVPRDAPPAASGADIAKNRAKAQRRKYAKNGWLVVSQRPQRVGNVQL